MDEILEWSCWIKEDMLHNVPFMGQCAKGRMIESEIGFDSWREGPWTTEGNEETSGMMEVCILVIYIL